jgi:diadenosine tetraphosphate (Ap4A) HIT family hydrolase
MTDTDCPFCKPSPSRIIAELSLLRILWDAFPVSGGHALIVPKRHIGSFFDLSAEEQQEFASSIHLARKQIERLYAPDGYNIGVNEGAAAGQTVAHMHCHVIPRYENDVPDARGGIRLVIPQNARYW